MNSPVLSVIVTVVDGGAALRRCLDALTTQAGAPAIEIVVPCDESVPGVEPLRDRYPTVDFLDAGRLVGGDRARSIAGQHELFDRRRAVGLEAARGDIVAMIEDRAVPRPDWAASIVAAHARLASAAIGGAIENAVDRPLNRAVYFCDFGRYHRPFAEGPREYVSDVNVSYKRDALQRIERVWNPRYHEPIVHWALQREGETVSVTPAIVVEQHRDDLRFGRLLVERFVWGRLFGALRAAEATPARRLASIVCSPLVPAVLFARYARQHLATSPSPGRFVATACVVLPLTIAWAAGEAVGAIAGEG